jgi:S-adenosylmethionine:tRNA ribosyltransferase-isomerase
MTINNIPKQLNASEFTYNLPEEKIAKYPLPERDISKLLVYQNKQINKTVFNSISQYLSAGDLLVFNNTKVIPARIKFNKSTGAQIEVFCLEPLEPADYAQAFQSKACTWKCIVGNLKKWKSGDLEKELIIDNKTVTLKATKVADLQSSQHIHFRWNQPEVSFERIIEASGITPIPPYLNRASEEVDKVRYQTVYSEVKGSVAAPTAGLHFTQALLGEIQGKGVKTANVALHVGAGTFKPMQSKDISEHEMHTEFFSVSAETLKSLSKNHGNLIAVGTTTLRSLESIYWLGVKLLHGHITGDNFVLKQWEPYNLPQNTSFAEAVAALLSYLKENETDLLYAHTQIMIVPGYTIQSIKALVTNFHQPNSTLLLLVASIVGDDWKTIYNYALDNDFRFLSYGDSSLLFL